MIRPALVLVLLASLAGCEGYAQSKIDLADQARRGVALARDAASQREQQLDAADARQRQQLDDAFDADVFARPALTADWVVAHRRAYAVALDALRLQRQAAERSRDRTLSNLDSVDSAIAQLQRMQHGELKLSTLEGK